MMHKRIKRIIIEAGLKSSSFADKIGVARGTITHILRGRNDPSNATIDKILKAFPNISLSWLIKGEEPMYISEIKIKQPPVEPVQTNIFEKNKVVETPVQLPKGEYPPENAGNTLKNKSNSPVIQSINQMENSSKKIVRISVYFQDKTYEDFYS